MSGSALTCSAASCSSPCSAMLSAFTGGRSSRMVASPPEDCTLTNSAISVAGVVLERQAQPDPEVLDPSVLDRDVLADHFGHPEVAHGAGCGLDRFACGVLPGLLADPDNLGHAVDTHRLSLAVLRPGVPVRVTDPAPRRGRRPWLARQYGLESPVLPPNRAVAPSP